MKTTHITRHTFYGLILGLLASTPASAVTISQSPLFISASVDPNVMLLIDNSGSMDNIVWADGYDNTVTYANWSDSGGHWDPTSGNVHYDDLPGGSCSSGWKEGENAGGTKKCLKLPNPSDDGDTRFSGNYLNYLFATYASGSDLTGGVIPDETRMQVARQAAMGLIDQTADVRFGAASFYDSDDGAQIDAACGSSAATVKSEIDAYRGTSWTPLAEALYEVTRYFRGLSSYYGSGTYTSPIQYRCQHNFAVVITDGLPTYDSEFPSNDPADVADTSASLPNWDGLEPTTTAGMYPNFPQYSDGFKTGGSNEEGDTLYLDDIAKFGYDIDMKTTGNDLAGVSFNSSDFPVQRMETYTIGFAQDNQMLEDAAAYGNGKYYTADDAASLIDALNQAIESVQFASKASSASVATNSTRLDTQTILYQARFNATDWTGNLIAFGIDATTGDISSTPAWTAADKLPPATGAISAASRKIYSYDAGNTTGIVFGFPSDYTSLGSGDMNNAMVTSLLANAPYSSTTTDTVERSANQTYGTELVNYLRGNTGTGGTYNGAFRTRSSVLGDIVNSNPVYVGTRDYGYGPLPGAEGTDYLAYRSSTAYKTRTPVVYVGANDGMLHAFHSTTGDELFAYVPSTVFPNLPALADPNYSHQYYVNGSPRANDAYVNGVWKTVLVGTPGAGGRGIFVLDVTSPDTFDESKVMYEFTSNDDADVGYVLGQPTIARMANGTYAAIFGNGYNSANDRAMLFIVSLNDGSVLMKFDTGVGDATTPNGLSAPIPVDDDGDRVTDYIYAGDLLGNMWKFDVDDSNTGQWKIAYKSGTTPKPLYEAKDASSNPQPITVRPTIGGHPDGGLMVYFGTGRYFANGDNDVTGTQPVQTFYGIHDDGAKVAGRGDLQQQSIIFEDYDVAFGTELHDVRAVSDTATDYSTKDGWYLDLQSPVNGAEGERVVNDAVLHNGRIIFSTLVPSADPCGFGGYSWLMELDAINGGRLDYSVFDLNSDGKFNSGDFVEISAGVWVPVSGKGFDEIVSQPVIIGAGEKEHKYVSGSSGDISHVVEKGDFYSGRQSWRQLQ